MRRKQAHYLKGHGSHRRTEADYMGVLLDAVTLDDWRAVVGAAVAAAKAGDGNARAWLAQYLVGKAALTAPSPLTVVVQQYAGVDPVVNALAKPHIDRLTYPALQADDTFKDAVKARVAEELRALEAACHATPPETAANPDGTKG